MIIYSLSEPPTVIWRSPGNSMVGAKLYAEQRDGGPRKIIGANLRGAILQGLDMRFADLREASLVGADLRGARLDEANLSGTNLGGAFLDGAVLAKAKLERASLVGAFLTETTDFTESILKGADLRGTEWKRAIRRGAVTDDAIFESDEPEEDKRNVGASPPNRKRVDTAPINGIDWDVPEIPYEDEEFARFVASLPPRRQDEVRAAFRARGLKAPQSAPIRFTGRP